MYRVDTIIRYQVRDEKTYQVVADALMDETVAHKMASALNNQEIKNNELLKAKESEIESLKQILPTSL